MIDPQTDIDRAVLKFVIAINIRDCFASRQLALCLDLDTCHFRPEKIRIYEIKEGAGIVHGNKIKIIELLGPVQSLTH